MLCNSVRNVIIFLFSYDTKVQYIIEVHTYMYVYICIYIYTYIKPILTSALIQSTAMNPYTGNMPRNLLTMQETGTPLLYKKKLGFISSSST